MGNENINRSRDPASTILFFLVKTSSPKTPSLKGNRSKNYQVRIFSFVCLSKLIDCNRTSITMCKEYQLTHMVGGTTTEETIITECSEKPPGGTIKDCPKYKLITAASSRKKQGLPAWATGSSSN